MAQSHCCASVIQHCLTTCAHTHTYTLPYLWGLFIDILHYTAHYSNSTNLALTIQSNSINRKGSLFFCVTYRQRVCVSDIDGVHHLCFSTMSSGSLCNFLPKWGSFFCLVLLTQADVQQKHCHDALFLQQGRQGQKRALKSNVPLPQSVQQS